jgi:tetratricopeptide (TPR) repeat protein
MDAILPRHEVSLDGDIWLGEQEILLLRRRMITALTINMISTILFIVIAFSLHLSLSWLIPLAALVPLPPYLMAKYCLANNRLDATRRFGGIVLQIATYCPFAWLLSAHVLDPLYQSCIRNCRLVDAEYLIRATACLLNSFSTAPVGPLALTGLPNIYLKVGRLDLAEPLFRRRLEQMEMGIDVQNEASIIYAYNNMGWYYLQADKPADARPFLEKALTILKSQIAPPKLFLSHVLINLGRVYLRLENLQEAEKDIEESLNIRLKMFRLPHPDTAESYVGLAELRLKQNRLDEAELHVQSAIAMYRVSSVDWIGTGLYAHHLHAQILKSMGKEHKSIEVLAHADELKEHAIQVNALRLSDLRTMLGSDKLLPMK